MLAARRCTRAMRGTHESVEQGARWRGDSRVFRCGRRRRGGCRCGTIRPEARPAAVVLAALVQRIDDFFDIGFHAGRVAAPIARDHVDALGDPIHVPVAPDAAARRVRAVDRHDAIGLVEGVGRTGRGPAAASRARDQVRTAAGVTALITDINRPSKSAKFRPLRAV